MFEGVERPDSRVESRESRSMGKLECRGKVSSPCGVGWSRADSSPAHSQQQTLIDGLTAMLRVVPLLRNELASVNCASALVRAFR